MGFRFDTDSITPASDSGGGSSQIESLNVTPTTSTQIITAPSGVDGYNPINVSAVTASIDNNIVANNIVSGVSILGVNGSATVLNGETVSITPTTSQQIITPTSPKNGITQATVAAVTSNIDSNIIAENIKKDVTILGVTGSLESGGGSVDHGGKYLVKVVDYDGSIIAEDHLNTGDVFTLPENPTGRERLTFQEWICTEQVIYSNTKTITVTNSDILIGALYTPTSGLSEFDIELNAITGLTVTFNISGTTNWGDGTSDNSTTHTYTNYGKYTITTSSTDIRGAVFGQTSSDYNIYCTAVRLAAVTINNSPFLDCANIKICTLSNGTVFGNYGGALPHTTQCIILPRNCEYFKRNTYAVDSFNNDLTFIRPLLKYCIIPYGEYINRYMFYGMWFFENFVLPKYYKTYNSYLTISDYCYHTYNLKTATISCELLNDSAFYECSTLQRVIINNTGMIASQAFYNCNHCLIYDFSNVSAVPTLSNANAFTGINTYAKILVPTSLESEWKTATNWSTYADYIYGV